MAAITWFGTNTLLSTQFQEMSETSPGADATSSPQMGWVVGTGTGVDYASMDAGTNVTAATFGATVQPDGSLVTGSGSNGDAFRSTNTYTGSFAAANWTWHGVVIGVTNSGAQDGHMDVRLFRGPNVDGTGATQITSAVQTGSTITNLSTTQQDSTVTFNPGAFSVTNEYIFVQAAWVRTGAGGMTTTDVAFRYGTTATRMISAAFTKAYILTATGGSAAETGTAVTLKVGHVVTASSGSIAEAGTNATLKVGRLVGAASGAFLETGTAAGLRVARVLAAASGSAAETGTAATLTRGLLLSASSGSVIETGTAATLTYTPISGHTLTAAGGSAALTGTAATLTAQRKVAASAGTIAESGAAAGLTAQRRLTATSGTLALTGTAATLTHDTAPVNHYTLTASPGALALAGSLVALEYDRIFSVDGAVLAIDGRPVTMTKFHPEPQRRRHEVATPTVQRTRRTQTRWTRIRRR